MNHLAHVVERLEKLQHRDVVLYKEALELALRGAKFWDRLKVTNATIGPDDHITRTLVISPRMLDGQAVEEALAEALDAYIADPLRREAVESAMAAADAVYAT